MRSTSDERSPTGVRLQAGKAFVAASTALSASAAVPSGKRPITCLKSEGLRESKCFGAPKSLPPIRFLPRIGSRFSTDASAARKASAFDATEKSVKGSLRNSGSKLGPPKAKIYQNGRGPAGSEMISPWSRRPARRRSRTRRSAATRAT